MKTTTVIIIICAIALYSILILVISGRLEWKRYKRLLKEFHDKCRKEYLQELSEMRKKLHEYTLEQSTRELERANLLLEQESRRFIWFKQLWGTDSPYCRQTTKNIAEWVKTRENLLMDIEEYKKNLPES